MLKNSFALGTFRIQWFFYDRPRSSADSSWLFNPVAKTESRIATALDVRLPIAGCSDERR
jgi:hypothetical protein